MVTTKSHQAKTTLLDVLFTKSGRWVMKFQKAVKSTVKFQYLK